MSDTPYPGYEALDPFFAIIKQGLAGLVDGEHYFDMLADDIVFEYPYAFPGAAPRIEGRAKLMAHFSHYGDVLRLDRMSGLIVHETAAPGVVILEYASHGHGVKTGNPYNNRYVSVITIRDRKAVHWRDYWNPMVVLNAVGRLEDVLEQMNHGQDYKA
ncbi:MAG: hypothetical protein JWR80_7623 [Bradyrhizobium sp.]|nr:hypothetical protein [Bradyrhizobium sp.]